MPIKSGQGYQDPATFRAAHKSEAYDPEKPPKTLPNKGYPVGADFFTPKTIKELQTLIDTTWSSRKKLDFSATNAQAVDNAKALLEAASSSSSGAPLTVRWGVHQHETRPVDGDVGKTKHFNIVAAEADWHLYINTDGSRIAYMSQTAQPGDMVSIKKP